MAPLAKVLVRMMPTFLCLCILYAGFLILGMGVARAKSPAMTGKDNVSQNHKQSLEETFGKFREPIRSGSIRAFVVVSMIVFAMNLLGTVLSSTLPGLLIIPAIASLGFTGWLQGMELAGMKASSVTSAIGFLTLWGIEQVAGVIGMAAGLNAGLALIYPGWLGETVRRHAFCQAWKDMLYVYGVIVLMLLIQAVLEVFYVRQVLLRGGTGIPLSPY